MSIYWSTFIHFNFLFINKNHEVSFIFLQIISNFIIIFFYLLIFFFINNHLDNQIFFWLNPLPIQSYFILNLFIIVFYIIFLFLFLPSFSIIPLTLLNFIKVAFFFFQNVPYDLFPILRLIFYEIYKQLLPHFSFFNKLDQLYNFSFLISF